MWTTKFAAKLNLDFPKFPKLYLYTDNQQQQTIKFHNYYKTPNLSKNNRDRNIKKYKYNLVCLFF